jgi:hypothetical protein
MNMNKTTQFNEQEIAIIKSTFTNRLDKHVEAIKQALSLNVTPTDNSKSVCLETFYALDWIVPILEDVVPDGEYYIEDAYAAVYGADGEEVHLVKEFMREFERIQLAM